MSTKDRFQLRAAVYLILVKDGKTLLSRRFKTGWMDGMYSLIAGHIDGDEKVSDAMIREAYEESGIKINKKDLHPAKVVHRKSNDAEYVDFFFVAEKWDGTPKIMETEKCDDMSWFPVDNLPEKLLPHVKEVLKTYKDGVSFFESGWE